MQFDEARGEQRVKRTAKGGERRHGVGDLRFDQLSVGASSMPLDCAGPTRASDELSGFQLVREASRWCGRAFWLGARVAHWTVVVARVPRAASLDAKAILHRHARTGTQLA